MKATNRTLGLVAVGGLLCTLQNAPAQAALITVSGAHVDFSYDSALLGLFGTPTVAGDNLFFSPAAFTAMSLNSAALATTTAATSIDIQAHPGYNFAGMTLTEQGNYKLRGTSGFVAASGELLAIDKNNPPADGPSASAFLTTLDDMTLSNGKMHTWSATAQIDLTGSAWANTDSVRLTLDNLLEAYTAPGDCTPVAASGIHGKHKKSRFTANSRCGAQLSFIQKKYSGLNVHVSNPPAAVVPVPAAVILFSSGAFTLLGFGLRRRVPHSA